MTVTKSRNPSKARETDHTIKHLALLSGSFFLRGLYIILGEREREREPIKARINGMRSEMRRDGRYRENYVAKVAGDVAELLRRNIDAAARHVFQPN